MGRRSVVNGVLKRHSGGISKRPHLEERIPMGDVVPQYIKDLQEWPHNGLPVASCWNTGGFVFDWHVNQARLGYRFIPSVKLNQVNPQSGTTLGPKLLAVNETFLRDSRLGICLRADNLAGVITALDRLPIALESIPNSPVVWSIRARVFPVLDANGKPVLDLATGKPKTFTAVTLGDEAIADTFGPPSIWDKAGYDWAKVAFLGDLQKRFPNAAFVLLADNNESNKESTASYVLGTTKDKYGDYVNVWRTPENLAKYGAVGKTLQELSLRVRDYAQDHTVAEFIEEFNTRQDVLYNSLFSGFNAGLDAWKFKLLTEAYKVGTFNPGYSPQFGHYDGGSGPLYISGGGNGITGDFTSPDWFSVYHYSPIALKAEASNPNHFRTVFIQVFPGATFDGYQAGRHGIVTPEHIAAWAQWILWSVKGNKRGVNLRYFEESKRKPTDPFYTSDAAKKIVSDAGYPEMANLTEEDFIRPLMVAVNTICDDPVLREFFVYGKPVQAGTHPDSEIQYFTTNLPKVFPPLGEPDDGFRLLECDLNTQRSQWVIKPGPNKRGGINPATKIVVWPTATERDGSYLVHLWTPPCPLPLDCKITLPNGYQFSVTITKPNEYVLVEPLVGYTATKLGSIGPVADVVV
jgi:hypothetical protein